jgi:hypothetical protein
VVPLLSFLVDLALSLDCIQHDSQRLSCAHLPNSASMIAKLKSEARLALQQALVSGEADTKPAM